LAPRCLASGEVLGVSSSLRGGVSRLPDDEEIRQAASRVDWRRVHVTDREIRLGSRQTAVTLNGIAQGFAADCAMAALQRFGVRHALVNTGEIGSLGSTGRGTGWKVGIQHPRREDAYVALAGLKGRCLATSGDYATTFAGGFTHHHLFDPTTGRSPAAFSSVSVAAGSAALADALSTSVFVLGPETGLRLIKSTPGADALFVFKDGSTLATDGFPRATHDAR